MTHRPMPTIHVARHVPAAGEPVVDALPDAAPAAPVPNGARPIDPGVVTDHDDVAASGGPFEGARHDQWDDATTDADGNGVDDTTDAVEATGDATPDA